MRKRYRKVLTLFLVFLFVFSSIPINYLTVSADSNITLKGFITKDTDYFSYNAFVFIGDNLKKYVLVDMDDEFSAQMAGKRVEVEMEIVIDEDPYYLDASVGKIVSMNVLDIEGDSSIKKVQKTGTFTLEVKEDHMGSMRYWNFKDTNNKNYVSVYDSDFTTLGQEIGTLDFRNLTTGIVGYEILSNQPHILLLQIGEEFKTEDPDVPEDPENPEDPDDPEDPDEPGQGDEDGNVIGVFQMKVDHTYINVKDYKEYKGLSLDMSHHGYTFKLIFDRVKMKENFPLTNLSGKNIEITALYEALNEDGLTELYVLDWKLISEELNRISIRGEIVSIIHEDEDSITYGIQTTEEPITGEINNIVFEKSILGKNYPSINLVGQTINAVVEPIPTDSGKVYDWAIVGEDDYELDEGEKEVPQTYYGILKKIMHYSKKSVVYLMEDYNGKEYIVDFLQLNLRHLPESDLEGRKITIKAIQRGYDGFTPILEVMEYEYNPDSFNHYDFEVVALTGIIKEEIGKNEEGRKKYLFKTTKGREYVAVFDKEVLGNRYPINNLEDEELQLFGVVYTENGVSYLGVMAYRDVMYEYSLDDYDYAIMDITPIRIVSQSADEILYQAANKNGDRFFILFSKDVLGDDYPNGILLGKEITIATHFFGEDEIIDKDTVFIVNAWVETNEEDFKTDRGIFKDLVESSDTAFVYNFESTRGGTYEVLISSTLYMELFDSEGGNSKVSGTVASIYGYMGEHNGRRVFVAHGINILSQEHINETKADIITFRGVVENLVSENKDGAMYFAKNSYGEYALLYFDVDYFKDKFPKPQTLLNEEVAIRGYIYSNGVLMVTDYQILKGHEEYPEFPVSPYREIEYFPNMQGYIGTLTVFSADTPYLVLVTSSDRYILEGQPEVIKEVEKHLGKIVYLMGEPSTVSYPYWTDKIKVYDLVPMSGLGKNVIIRPAADPIHYKKEDPMKTAIHTVQELEKPADFEYGDGIKESVYMPTAPKADYSGKDQPYK